MAKGNKPEGLSAGQYLLLTLMTVAVFALCVCAGSVTVPIRETVTSVWAALSGNGQAASAIIVSVRLPRVICTALCGAALALCGATMQGLLRNPLADGSTMGVSSGAALGAVLAIALGFSIPGIPGSGVTLAAIVFAGISLVLILSLAYNLDHSLTTHTIILIGVVFSMFANSMISLIQTFSREKVKTIVFWMMGSLADSSYQNVLTILAALFICGAVVLCHARELNAFAVGEDNARNIGVNVRRIKLMLLIAVSALIGVCVSIGGSIGFAGLIIPHITRMLTGPNHKRLLPASMFLGALFLMLADLTGRVILRPLEVPVGVVTAIIGAVVFVYIFYQTRKVR